MHLESSQALAGVESLVGEHLGVGDGSDLAPVLVRLRPRHGRIVVGKEVKCVCEVSTSKDMVMLLEDFFGHG